MITGTYFGSKGSLMSIFSDDEVVACDAIPLRVALIINIYMSSALLVFDENVLLRISPIFMTVLLIL